MRTTSASPAKSSKRWRAGCERAAGERTDEHSSCLRRGAAKQSLLLGSPRRRGRTYDLDGAPMTTPQAPARIYAGALFDIAVENRMVDQIADELRAVSSAIDGLDAQLRGFFEMPQIRKEDKQRVVNLAFEGKVSRPVLGLLHVLVDKRREPLLDAIVADFGELVDESEGRVRANVTSASALDADLADAIRAALEQRTQRRVVLRQRVDPGVLGGIRVSLGDLVIDGTLRRGLLDLRRTLAAAQQ